MAKVSLNDRDTEAESFVGRLLLHERFSWNHQWLLTWQEDI
jgi:hypothetical protein